MRAAETRALVRQQHAFEKMTPYLASADDSMLAFTLCAMQNLCTESAYVQHMQDTGVAARLEELARSGDVRFEPFANGCLANMRQAAAYMEEPDAQAESSVDCNGELTQVPAPPRRTRPPPSPRSRPIRCAV